jgi:hypothetical protein
MGGLPTASSDTHDNNNTPYVKDPTDQMQQETLRGRQAGQKERVRGSEAPYEQANSLLSSAQPTLLN